MVPDELLERLAQEPTREAISGTGMLSVLPFTSSNNWYHPLTSCLINSSNNVFDNQLDIGQKKNIITCSYEIPCHSKFTHHGVKDPDCVISAMKSDKKRNFCVCRVTGIQLLRMLIFDLYTTEFLMPSKTDAFMRKYPYQKKRQSELVITNFRVKSKQYTFCIHCNFFNLSNKNFL